MTFFKMKDVHKVLGPVEIRGTVNTNKNKILNFYSSTTSGEREAGGGRGRETTGLMIKSGSINICLFVNRAPCLPVQPAE
jgi:hypothetical protein